jgi:hypothetical protein
MKEREPEISAALISGLISGSWLTQKWFWSFIFTSTEDFTESSSMPAASQRIGALHSLSDEWHGLRCWYRPMLVNAANAAWRF